MYFGRRHVLPLLLLIAASACASQQRDTRSPSVAIEQISNIARFEFSPAGGVPVDYRIHITNPLDVAVTLKSVELETVGLSGAYSMRRMRHHFDETIAANGSTNVDVRGWVIVLQRSQDGSVGMPVTLRGIARFTAADRDMRTAFAARVQ